MEYFGLLILGGMILWGLMAVADGMCKIAKQMRRRNDLKEADLRHRGIVVGEPQSEA